MRDELTVCTVSYGSRRVLALNRALASALNPEAVLHWVVAENSPPDSPERLAPGDGWKVIEGAAPDALRARPRSYQHGAALNTAVAAAATRFVLVLDPDFFVVRPRWVRDVLDHVQAHGLAFFGVPWHPRWYEKPRGFPCVHCLFVDRERLGSEGAALDFRPGESALGSARQWVAGLGASAVEQRAAGPVRALVRTARKAGRAALGTLDGFTMRRQIGQSQDTGYLLERRFARHPSVAWESVMPVVDPGRDYRAPGPGAVARAFDRLLPDSRRYLTRDERSFTRRGFSERIGVDTRSHGAEEFVWREAPFGFHLRGQQVHRTPAEAEALLNRLLADVTGLDVRAPSRPLSSAPRRRADADWKD